MVHLEHDVFVDVDYRANLKACLCSLLHPVQEEFFLNLKWHLCNSQELSGGVLVENWFHFVIVGCHIDQLNYQSGALTYLFHRVI